MLLRSFVPAQCPWRAFLHASARVTTTEQRKYDLSIRRANPQRSPVSIMHHATTHCMHADATPLLTRSRRRSLRQGLLEPARPWRAGSLRAPDLHQISALATAALLIRRPHLTPSTVLHRDANHRNPCARGTCKRSQVAAATQA